MSERRICACILLLGLLLAATQAILPASATAGQPSGRATAGPCWARLNDLPVDYPTVQAAVDASTSPTDVVKVAGYCAGVTQRGGMTQTVYLSKTLALQGGYTVTNWTAPDPLTNPTTLDAVGQGRVLLVYGDIHPVVAGLRITGGDATRAGADPYGQNRGGGSYVFSATATISDCTVLRNSADSGGGLYTYASALTLRHSTFTTNTASLIGGGMLMYEGAGRLEGNAFISNTAGTGAGAYFGSEAITLTANVFLSNSALFDGGGVIVEVYGGNSELVGNTVAGNRAYWNGGGLYFGEGVRSGHNSDHLLFSGNVIANNWARNDGGGVFMSGDGGAADFVGNTVQGNEAGGDGGGVYLDWSADPTPILSNTVSSNTAHGDGGGIYLGTTTATVRGNIVRGNVSTGNGGGIFGNGVLQGNTILSNTAVAGGGLALGWVYSQAQVDANVIAGNSAQYGGGIYLHTGRAELESNLVIDNIAVWDGGGINQIGGAVTLTSNIVTGNSAEACGGGLELYDSQTLLVNNVIANNAGHWGAGVDVFASSCRFIHTTIARNTGASGIQVLDHIPLHSTLLMTDTILEGHSVGIVITASNVVSMEATLWGNDIDWAGAESLYTGTVNVWGPPNFVDPAGGDYHLGPGSAALDAGVPAGVATDIDGDPRPIGWGYDLGADESPVVRQWIYLPLVVR